MCLQQMEEGELAVHFWMGFSKISVLKNSDVQAGGCLMVGSIPGLPFG